MSKSVLWLWSKLAFESVGQEFVSVRAQAETEIADIMQDAYDWFLHAIPLKNDEIVIVFNGRETPDEWEIQVQAARWKQSDSGEKKIKLPEIIDDPDNETYGQIIPSPG